MAGKPVTRASNRVARVIDHLSKNTLADILLDRIAAEIGEDATDEQVLAHLQPWLDTITRLRGDKTVSLDGLMRRFDGKEQRYLEREQEKKERMAVQLETEQRMAKRIDGINAEKLKYPFESIP